MQRSNAMGSDGQSLLCVVSTRYMMSIKVKIFIVLIYTKYKAQEPLRVETYCLVLYEQQKGQMQNS